MRLTPRQKQVAELLMTGASNQEIADDMGLKMPTIKLHVRNICSKLGVTNRTKAALMLYKLSQEI